MRADVDLEDAVPVLGACVLEAPAADDAYVRDDTVEAIETRVRFIHHALDLDRVADIGDDGKRGLALGVHLAGRLLYGGGIYISDRHAGPFAGEQPAHRTAIAHRGVLDVVALLPSTDDEDLAPREAFAAGSGAVEPPAAWFQAVADMPGLSRFGSRVTTESQYLTVSNTGQYHVDDGVRPEAEEACAPDTCSDTRAAC